MVFDLYGWLMAMLKSIANNFFVDLNWLHCLAFK